MLSSNFHKSIIVINSIETRFSRMFLRLFTKLAGWVLSGYAPIKPSHSFIKHFIRPY